MYNLYFYHDPMCSWCWGYRKTSDQLFKNLPDNIKLNYILGGLAPDSDEPMPMEMQAGLMDSWARINKKLGTQFNFDFWKNCKPRRSTYQACRAVISAGKQNAYIEMIDAIQRGYYLNAMNPSNTEDLTEFARSIDLNIELFIKELNSKETEQKLQQDILFTRQTPSDGYPSLALSLEEGKYTPIILDYMDYSTTIEHIEATIKNYLSK